MTKRTHLELLNAIEGIVWAADPVDFRYSFVSGLAERLLGYPVQRWTSEPGFWLERVHPEDREYAARSRRRAVEVKKRCEFEYRMVARDGRIVWVRDIVNVTLEGDRPAALHGIMLDISEAKRMEEALYHTAFHDPLTNLPNRKLFEIRLEQAMKRAKRHPEHRFAVMFMDLDHFKVINDSLGHLAGDRLLVETAARLAICVRDSDTVARFGGDEFGILLEDIEDPSHVLEIAGRIEAAVREPFLLREAEGFTPTASIGIAIGNSAYAGPREVLRDADIALYRAKESGRRPIEIFDPSMTRGRTAGGDLEGELRRAFDQGRLQLAFEEIRAVPSWAPAAFEVFLRWQHALRGLVPAEAFRSLAEDSGLAVPIGWWTLQESCHHLKRWRQLAGSALRIHVNLGARQLSQADLTGRFAEVLGAARLSAGAVHLEIPETVLMENITTLASKLDHLKALGLGLVVDDFGTGYSPLARLQDLPLDCIKIDRRHIRGLRSARADSTWTEAVLGLARSLGIRTIAAGVESAEELALLRELGCDYVQGKAVAAVTDAEGVTSRLAAMRARA